MLVHQFFAPPAPSRDEPESAPALEQAPSTLVPPATAFTPPPTATDLLGLLNAGARAGAVLPPPPGPDLSMAWLAHRQRIHGLPTPNHNTGAGPPGPAGAGMDAE